LTSLALSAEGSKRSKLEIGVRCAPAALNAQLKNVHGDPDPQRRSDEKLLIQRGKGGSASFSLHAKWWMV